MIGFSEKTMGNKKLAGNPLQNRKRKNATKTALFLDEAVRMTRRACWEEDLSESEATITINSLNKLRASLQQDQIVN
jgi:hypothetical protein